MPQKNKDNFFKTCCSNIKKIKIKNHSIDNEIISIDGTRNISPLAFFKKHPFGILMMIISSLLFNIGIKIFIVRAQTIPSGLTAVPTLLTYVWPELNSYFSLIYLAVNLPFLIFFFNKIKRSFIYLTILWMIFQILWEQILNISIIRDTIMYHTSFVKDWNHQSPNDSWLMLVYTLIGSIFATLGIGLSWKFGGSSGGTDIISYYYSTRKQKAIGKFMLIISLSIAFSSLMLLYGLGKGGVIQPTVTEIFGIKTFSTIIWVLTLSLGINIIYPKYKKVLISIYTTKHNEIRDHLNNIKYWHSFNVWEGVSGYTGRKVQKIETIALVLETNYLIKQIKSVDPNSWITLREITIKSGKLDTTKID